jgi:hypothetical protein
LKERDTGVLSEEFFQKDHFVAQNWGEKIDLDAYDNMVYACEKCNRTKSDHDIGKILNPCRDDIFGGNNPQVINPGKSVQYQLIGLTPEGRQYIDVLQLNSNYYRKLREYQEEEACSDNELKAIIAELEERGDIPGEILSKLGVLLRDKIGEQRDYLQSIEFRCGKSKAGYAFQNVVNNLAKAHIPYELIFEENDLDIAIQYQGSRYLCEIVLNNEKTNPVTNIHPQKEKIENWIKKEGKFGILYYYIKTGRLDFYQMGGEKKDFIFCETIAGNMK